MKVSSSLCLLVLAAAVGGSACLVGPIPDIPCGDDDECPTAAFCDIPAEHCVESSETVFAPAVAVVAVVDANGDEVRDPFVLPDVESALEVILENRGGVAATNVRLELARLACLQQTTPTTAVAATLAPGARVKVPLVVTPRDCSSPVITDWFAFFSGRAIRGTFNINIARSP